MIREATSQTSRWISTGSLGKRLKDGDAGDEFVFKALDARRSVRKCINARVTADSHDARLSRLARSAGCLDYTFSSLFGFPQLRFLSSSNTTRISDRRHLFGVIKGWRCVLSLLYLSMSKYETRTREDAMLVGRKSGTDFECATPKIRNN